MNRMLMLRGIISPTRRSGPQGPMAPGTQAVRGHRRTDPGPASGRRPPRRRRSAATGTRGWLWVAFAVLVGTVSQGALAERSPETGGALDENWKRFKHHQRFEMNREALRERWSELHRRDTEPFPDAARIRAVATALGREPPEDPNAIARAMQDAWRAYHAGRLRDAYRQARAQGPYGYYLAERTWVAYTATQAPKAMRLPLLEAAVARIEANPQPRSTVRLNAYWVQGLLLGQYSRYVSTSKARAEDIPDRVRRVLDWVLEHRPDHAQAWINLGAYHAEIIQRIGWLLAKMTYGANAEDAAAAFDRGLTLAPDMAVGYGEAAMGLHRIDPDEYADRIARYAGTLRALEPLDAEDFLERRRSLRLLEAAGY